MIAPPDCAFHSYTCSRKASRPISPRLDPPALEGLRFDDHLRANPSMVRADHPQGVLASHALPPGQDVLQRIVERVADMQRAREMGGGTTIVQGPRPTDREWKSLKDSQ